MVAKQLLLLMLSAIISSGGGSDDSVCLLPRQNLCFLPGVPQDRYYYDTGEQRCIGFVFLTGCDRNGNNFLTLEECQSTCSTPASTQQHTTTEDSTQQHTGSQASTEFTSRTIQATTTTDIESSTETTPSSLGEVPLGEVELGEVTTTTVQDSTTVTEESTSETELNRFAIISIAIAVVVTVVVCVCAAIIWRVIRLRLHRTTIMNKEEPVVLTYFTEGLTTSKKSKDKDSIQPQLPNFTPVP